MASSDICFTWEEARNAGSQVPLRTTESESTLKKKKKTFRHSHSGLRRTSIK